MKHTTGIEWTHVPGYQGETWNPIVGCSIVSPGCTNCYAMTFAGRRLDGNPAAPHYAGTTMNTKAGPVWTGKVALAEHKLTEPLKAKKPRCYFVNSMGDLFHENVSDEWIDKVFSVMALCPQHIFIVLTKRSKRMREYMASDPVSRWVDTGDWKADGPHWNAFATNSRAQDLVFNGLYVLPNVWLGVSAERQQEADERIPDLLATPAAVRLVSIEPMLWPVNLTRLFDYSNEHAIDALRGRRYHSPRDEDGEQTGKLDWVICGGESGPNARPMHPDWVRALRDDCARADVPFFFKQWGEWAPGECAQHPQTRTEMTASLFDHKWRMGAIARIAGSELHRDDQPDVYRFGKARAGRLIDGLLHSEFPTCVQPPHQRNEKGMFVA